MKKKILGAIAVLAIAAAITFNVNLSNQTNGLSDVALTNVETLAQGETGTNVVTCYSTFRVTTHDPNENEWAITDCNGCTPETCYEYRDSGTCTTTGGFILV